MTTTDLTIDFAVAPQDATAVPLAQYEAATMTIVWLLTVVTTLLAWTLAVVRKRDLVFPEPNQR